MPTPRAGWLDECEGADDPDEWADELFDVIGLTRH